MKRVVITGMGIISSIGNNKKEVLTSLKEGRSGIEFSPDYEKQGMASHVQGSLKINTNDLIDRKMKRFMGEAAAYAYLAMKEAIEDAHLSDEQVSHPLTGIVAGSGGPSTSSQVEAVDTLREKGMRRVGPFYVPKVMSSSVSACLATSYKIKGVNYSITSACSTSAHCIGHGAELIQMGKQNIVFAGGGEELHWTLSMLFDAMKALSSGYNSNPTKASRAFDKNRDGFVISGGGGMLVLEEYEHAKKRGAKIYAELVGYGANSDGFDMVAPSGEGAMRCMQQACQTVSGKIDYINAHGTSTPVGDLAELKAIREAFGKDIPMVSSTKSLTGHSLGAAGVHEAIYSLLMLENDFVTASANIDDIEESASSMPIVLKTKDHPLTRVMSNSFGFGGTNASLVFEKVL